MEGFFYRDANSKLVISSMRLNTNTDKADERLADITNRILNKETPTLINLEGNPHKGETIIVYTGRGVTRTKRTTNFI